MISWTALHRDTLLLVYCQGMISGLKFDESHNPPPQKCTLTLNSRVRETRMFALSQPKRGEHAEASGCC